MTTSGESAATARSKTPVRRLIRMLRPDRADVGSVIVFSVLTGALLLATPVAVQALVNNVAFGATAPSIAILAGLLFLALALGAAVFAVQTWIVEILQRRIFVRLVADLSERLRRISWEVRDSYYNPELVNRFFDVVTIQKASSKLLLDGIGNLLSIVVGLVVIAFYHPLLFAMDVGIFAVVIMIFLFPLRAGSRTAIRESESKYAVAAWFEEITRHPLTFRTNGSEAFVRARSRALAHEYVDARRSHFRVVFGQILAALGLQVLAGTAVLGLGGWLVVQGELTLGQLVAAELIVAVVVQGVAKMGKHAETWYDLVAAVDKVGKLTDLEVEGDESAGLELPGPRPATLDVRELPLGGGEESTFSLGAGEIVAVTGPHGSGKSYLLELLFGLRRPTSGHIGVDGMNQRDIPLGDYRRDVALVSDSGLIEATILENLLLGREIPLPEVHEALEAVGLLEDVRALSDGLGTMLKPTGAPLSSGQANRLAMARVILSRPRLLLVDALLDDLSVPSRQRVMDALHHIREECSVIVVTSEEDIADRCDRRVELGTPLELSS